MPTSTTTQAYTDDKFNFGNNGKRPPADTAVNEIFLDKKCGRFGTGNLFFQSCMSPSPGEIKGIKCEGLGGSTGACDMSIRFIFRGQAREIGNVSTTTLRPPAQSSLPSGFSYTHICGFGPGKGTKWTDDVMIPQEKMQEVMEFCRQEIYGPPASLPIWLILLIILLVITAVSITAFLFWRFWLSRVLNRRSGDKSSNLSRFYTSTPFSSERPSMGSRSSSKKMRRASTQPSASASATANAGSNQGPFKLSGNTSSATAKQASVRSGMSARSLSGRTGQPRATN